MTPVAGSPVGAVGMAPTAALARPGGTMRAVVRGAGDDVLCVHGNPTWSLYYRHLVTALADRHRVIVPDHLGMGHSDHPPADRYPFDLAARVDDLTALADHLDVGRATPATLVVHDWGGAIALTWAVRNPGRVGRVVVLNTAAFPLPAGRRLPLVLRAVQTPLLGAALVRAGAFTTGTLRVGVRRRRLGRVLRRAYLAPYRSAARRTAVLRFVHDVPAGPGGRTHAILAETGAGLRSLADRPALIVWGGRDPVLTPDYLERWLDLWPHAEAHLIADAGHLVLEDAPEAVPLVVDFLARTAP